MSSSSASLPSYRRTETLEFSKSIPSSILDDICPSRLKSTSTFNAVKHTREEAKKNCVGKRVEDSNHPAYPSYGLFASRKLSSLERVIDYHGFVTLNGEEDKESDYTYSFAKRRLVRKQLGRKRDFATTLEAFGKSRTRSFLNIATEWGI